jgi:hypothetical protein
MSRRSVSGRLAQKQQFILRRLAGVGFRMLFQNPSVQIGRTRGVACQPQTPGSLLKGDGRIR